MNTTPNASYSFTLRLEIPNRVGKHREDNAADDVPTTDIEIREPSFKEREDKLEGHQNEGKDDESSYDERKLRPLQRLAETSGNQHPTGKDYRKIPDPEKEPSQLTAQDRPICEAWHRVIKEGQECVAQPSEEYALRMVVPKPAPGVRFGVIGFPAAERDLTQRGQAQNCPILAGDDLPLTTVD